MNTKRTFLELEDLSIVIVYKPIKNVHLTVHPPDGEVRVSAPLTINPDIVRAFVFSKLSWIKRQQQKILARDREAPRQYINGENHFFCGQSYLLQVIERQGPPEVNLTPQTLKLYVRPHTSQNKRHHLISEWYRQQLKLIIPALIAKYEPIMGVEVREFGVKRMKTRWGTCNPRAQRIWLNLELAKKPVACLEYVVVHEMAHLLEPKHNDRFWGFIDTFYPQWRQHREGLNRLPLG
ncbi:M48 family metallopeptidase [Synechocystis salina LEGE 06155]|nr:M48 family metallopeptidase [Synechocystis salina LEGE 06155]